MMDVDSVATFMISIVTRYFASCGDSLETLLNETSDRKPVRKNSSRMKHVHDLNHHFSDQMTEYSGEGVVSCESFDRTNECRPFETQRISGTDLTFFPRPSYERPYSTGTVIGRKSSSRDVVSRPGGLQNHGLPLRTILNHHSPSKEVIVPPPDVASKWIAMGMSKENVGNNEVPIYQKQEQQLQQYPFDEVCTEKATSRRPPLGTRQSRFATNGPKSTKTHLNGKKQNTIAMKSLDNVHETSSAIKTCTRSHAVVVDQNNNNNGSNNNCWHNYFYSCETNDDYSRLQRPAITREETIKTTNSFRNSSIGDKTDNTHQCNKEHRGSQLKMASHWKSATDPNTGKTYYYHEVTRETQWRKPMELATDEERIAMEQKAQKEKDFFAAMEANIMNCFSQGIVPGTSTKEDSPLLPPRIEHGLDGKVGAQIESLPSFRRSSLRKPSIVNPDLVRTISTMDETVLLDVIRRQPSIHTVKRGFSKREPSLQMEDLMRNGSISSECLDGFESWASNSEASHYSFQGNLETLKEDAVENNESTSLEKSMGCDLYAHLPQGPNLISQDNASQLLRRGTKIDGNRSVASGDLSWTETKALTKLVGLTKEMMDADEADHDESGGLSLSSNENVSNQNQTQTRTLQRVSEGDIGRALPREMNFEDSDVEEEKPAPLRRRDRAARMLANSSKSAADILRPVIQRRNTCGTMYIRTTMSAPDKDATIRCVCGVYRSHILSSENTVQIDNKSPFKVFNDYPEGTLKKHNYAPSLNDVTKFYRDIFFKAQMETDCIIMSLIYVERLIKKTYGRLRPRANNWRSLLFSCMILSSKVWDDLSMWNGDFSQSCPPGTVNFSLQRTNQLELAILNTLKFNVKVPASEYAKYYFLLRSMLIKSGLSGEDFGSLNPLDVDGARRLQQVSTQFESKSLTKSDEIPRYQRSRSLAIQPKNSGGNTLHHPKTKVGLEQVVKMS